MLFISYVIANFICTFYFRGILCILTLRSMSTTPDPHMLVSVWKHSNRYTILSQ